MTRTYLSGLGRKLVVVGLIYSLLPKPARTEDLVSYKFQSWQEDGGRIRVDAHYALLEKDLGLETKLKVTGLVDAIAGRRPTASRPRRAATRCRCPG
jgi:hypothetical protein